MTILLRLITYATFCAVLLSPLVLIDKALDGLMIGPVLRTPLQFAGTAFAGLTIVAFYCWTRNKHLAAWRCLYLAASVPAFSAAYVSTGYKWPMDRAMLVAKAEERHTAAR